MSFENTQALLNRYANDQKFDRYAVAVGVNGREIFCTHDVATNRRTLFDMASVTKIIGVTLPLLLAVGEGKLSLSDTLSRYFDSCPNDKKDITIEQLLTHSGGISPIWFLCDRTDDASKAVDIILNEPMCGKPGEQVVYSCTGFILLGKILEKVYGNPLDIILKQVTCPTFGLSKTTYNPVDDGSVVLSDNSGTNPVIVNDLNARFLNGVAGNAGVYSCIDDISRLCGILCNSADGIIKPDVFENAVSNHTPMLSESRGLGFLYVDNRYSQTGELFPTGSFGHCGHTGTSYFVNRESGVYAAVLTNMTRFCPDYNEVMTFRKEIHNVIKSDICEVKICRD